MKLIIACVKCGMEREIDFKDFPVSQNPKQRALECPICRKIGIAVLEMRQDDKTKIYNGT